MRRDMQHLLTQGKNPRRIHRTPNPKISLVDEDQWDNFPKSERKADRRDMWSIIDKGVPVRFEVSNRWLRSRIGRPWNDVHSELCRVVKDRRLRRMLFEDQVELDVVMVDGVPCRTRWGCYGWKSEEAPLPRLWGDQFYVDSTTGFLEVMPTYRYRRQKRKPNMVRVLGEGKPVEMESQFTYDEASNRVFRNRGGIWMSQELKVQIYGLAPLLSERNDERVYCARCHPFTYFVWVKRSWDHSTLKERKRLGLRNTSEEPIRCRSVREIANEVEA